MNTTNILFSGVGGQGIILAGKMLAGCAFLENIDVKESELHGMAQRGGSVVCHVRFGKEVYSPIIKKGSVDLLVAMEELEGLRATSFLKKKARIILNERRIIPASAADISSYPENVKKMLEDSGFLVDKINAYEIAKDLGTAKAENVVLLGALSSYLDFSVSLWNSVIKRSVPEKTLEINIEAFRKGRELTSCPKPVFK